MAVKPLKRWILAFQIHHKQGVLAFNTDSQYVVNRSDSKSALLANLNFLGQVCLGYYGSLVKIINRKGSKGRNYENTIRVNLNTDIVFLLDYALTCPQIVEFFNGNPLHGLLKIIASICDQKWVKFSKDKKCQQNYQYIIDYSTNQMKGGVRINNYVDNRVVLSGRKLKNDMQAVVQSHRPRPLIIHHINYIEPQQLVDSERSPKQEVNHMSGNKRKKRTKTVAINNNLDSQSISRKNRVSVSLENLKKGMTSAKKKSPSSSPSKQSDQAYLNETQKRNKPALKSAINGGLGKRSKSAIIKTNKSPERINLRDQPKTISRKNTERNAMDKQASNIKKEKKTNQSVNLTSNKTKTKKKLTQEKDKNKGSLIKPNNSTSVHSSIKKMGSLMHLQLNKKKQSKDSSKVSARKTTRNFSKSQNTSAKQSKPVSARDNRNKGIVKKRLFEAVLDDQTQIMEPKRQVEHINLSKLLAEHGSNQSVKKMINQLEIALNTIGSRKKITRDLEIITESVKALANKEQFSDDENQEEEEYEEEEEEEQEEDSQIERYQAIIQNGRIQDQQQVHEFLEFPSQENDDIKKALFKSDDGMKCQQDEQENEMNEQSDEIIYDEKINDEEIQKMLSQTKKRSQLHKQLFEDEEQIRHNEMIKLNKIQKRDEDTETYERLNPDLINLEQNDHSNPLLDRRGFGQVDMNDYDSIKSHQDERESEISLLKKFQQESDLMMKKVKRKLEIQVQETQAFPKEPKQEQSDDLLKPKQKIKTPINNERYAFDKFPQQISPEITAIRSPKFSEHEIVEVIKLKQKVLTDRHEKLGQLVNTLYSKHLVSPKTYNLHLNSLQKKYEEDNQVLDHHRKHAEELAKLLSDIKKQRAEIHDIDQLIRSEKWTEAMGVINSQPVEQRPKLPRQQSIRIHINGEENDLQNEPEHESVHEQSLESQEEAPLYYGGDVHEQNQSLIKLVAIPDKQESSEEDSLRRSAEEIDSGPLIKIDESNFSSVKGQEVQNRGFDSNLFFIKEYCISLCEFVRDNYKEEFKKNLSYPIEFDLDELLESFRTLKNGEPAQKINSLYQNIRYHDCFRKQRCPPISEFVFDEFNKTYEGIRFYGKKQNPEAALEGIFLRSIYNALNESIAMERPGSLQGKALPWAHTSKHLKNLKNSQDFQKEKNPEEEDLIFGIAVARIIQWGSCLCGFIPDTVDLMNTEIDEEYINHIRQTRMALLLQKMLSDQQAEMAMTELQETEVNLHLSDLIYQELMKEASSDIRKIQTRNALRMVDY